MKLMKFFSVRLPDVLVATIKRIAKASGRTMQAVVADALAIGLRGKK